MKYLTYDFGLEASTHLLERAEERGYIGSLDSIYDAVELATRARKFTNLNGETQRYLLVNLGLEVYGVGYIKRGDILVLRTLLSPRQILDNEERVLGCPEVEEVKEL